MGSTMPFWVLKDMKICNFVDATFIFEKYGPSAFQNRSGNIAATSSCDFMQIWSLVKMAKKSGGGPEKKLSQLVHRR